MAVHAIQIVCSKEQESNPSNVPSPKPPSLPNVLPDRVKENVFSSHRQVLKKQNQELGIVRATEMTGFSVDHVRGVYRVSKNSSKKQVLDDIENGVVADAKWYKIEAHECDHDEPAENRTGCGSWKTERTKGNVPDRV